MTTSLLKTIRWKTRGTRCSVFVDQTLASPVCRPSEQKKWRNEKWTLWYSSISKTKNICKENNNFFLNIGHKLRHLLSDTCFKQAESLLLSRCSYESLPPGGSLCKFVLIYKRSVLSAGLALCAPWAPIHLYTYNI